MIFLVVIVFALLTAMALGLNPRALRDVRFHAAILLPVAMLLQVVPGVLLGDRVVEALAAASWIAGAMIMLLVAAFNWRFVGLRVAAIGVLCNSVVIALNVGMPIGTDALSMLGSSEQALRIIADSQHYHLQSEATRALVLADVLPLPGPAGIRAIVSLGDLLLLVGIWVTIVQASDSRPAPAALRDERAT